LGTIDLFTTGPSRCRCRQVTVLPIRIGTLFAQPNLDAQPKSASFVLRQLSMKGLTRAGRIASRTCGISAPGVVVKRYKSQQPALPQQSWRKFRAGNRDHMVYHLYNCFKSACTHPFNVTDRTSFFPENESCFLDIIRCLRKLPILHPDDPDNWSEEKEFLMPHVLRRTTSGQLYIQVTWLPINITRIFLKAAYHPLQSDDLRRGPRR